MKITDIETVPISVPIDPARAITGSRGSHIRSPYLIIRIHTDEGLTGLGEVSCTPRWSGEDSATARHVIERYVAPRLIGQDPREVERLGATMDATIVGHLFTKAGVEMAAWDLLGKAAEMPLYRLLGGPVRMPVRTKFSISGAEPERSASIATWACDRGFRAMKVKVGTGLDNDLPRVKAVREAIGPNVVLGVDANCGWTRAEAAAAIAPLADFGIAFIEQPVRARDLTGMAEIRKRAAVTIVADEAVGTPDEALEVVRADAADVLSIYVGMAGGIGAARRIAAVAAAAGLGWTIGSNLELGIGLSAHLHFAAATLGLADDTVPCDIISTFYYEDDILLDSLPIEPGSAKPPEGHGLGVELDEKKVELYREDA
jgi:L-alanine-DL-glutamate epimerase-like enolase superfamily enzyme